MKMLISPMRLFPLLVTFALVSLIACKKETSDVSQQDETVLATTSAESDAEASTVFDDVFDNVMGVNAEVGFGETGVFSVLDKPETSGFPGVNRTDSLIRACFTVSIIRLHQQDLFPVKVILDFGTGCTGRDGRTRKGKIITIYTGRLIVPGKVAETSFDGYYVNDVHVQGTHRIENASTSQSLIFKVTVKDGKLTKLDSNFTLWNSNTTITQNEGLSTPYWPKDDIFNIRSEASGSVKTNSVFFKWTSRTIEPLIKKFTCHWIAKGRIAIRLTNTDAAIIDYGNGECDNKASITINGATREISLR